MSQSLSFFHVYSQNHSLLLSFGSLVPLWSWVLLFFPGLAFSSSLPLCFLPAPLVLCKNHFLILFLCWCSAQNLLQSCSFLGAPQETSRIMFLLWCSTQNLSGNVPSLVVYKNNMLVLSLMLPFLGIMNDITSYAFAPYFFTSIPFAKY